MSLRPQAAAIWHIGLLIGVAMWVSAARGDVPAPAEPSAAADIKTLIAQLGDTKFSVRKSAGEKLARIGLPAYQALEEATHDSDREIRYRAEKVLSVIRQNDLNRRLTIFLASLDSPEDRTLPAWGRFKTAHGNTAVSRSLFVEMQRVEGELLAQLEVDPRKATDLLSKRAVALADDLNRLNREGITLSFAQIAAVFFVAGEGDVKPSSSTIGVLLRLATQASLRSTTNPTEANDKAALEKAVVAKKLLGTIVAKADDSAAMQAVQIAMIYDMKEGLSPALKVLDAPPRVRQYVQYAMLIVAKYGDDSHLPALEKLFADNTIVATTSSRGVRREVQVRDSALAAAVVMKKQSLKDYFPVPENQPGLPGNQGNLAMSSTSLNLGFENDDQRAAAFAKWEAFKSKQPAPPKK